MTRTPSNPKKLRSLYAHTSRWTRSTSSTFSAPTTSSRGSQSETSPAFTNGTSDEMANHLNRTFGTLVFPPELATRLLTHASHPASKVVGHNFRFAFAGECSYPFHSPPSPPVSYHPPTYDPSLYLTPREDKRITNPLNPHSNLRPPSPRSLLPYVPPLVSKRKLWRGLREHHLERPQHIHSRGTRRSGVEDWECVEMEVDGGSADGCEGSGQWTCWIA